MTKLSVNINAVAYLRNRRDLSWPNLIRVARAIVEAGADGITIHPRPDERHIRLTDVAELTAMLASYPGVEFNIEGFPSREFLDLVERARPQQVTLVPDDPSQATSDHGWDVPPNAAMLRPVVARLQAAGMRVSLFIDEDPAAAAAVAELGADRVELYTAPYGGSPVGSLNAEAHLRRLVATAQQAIALGLDVNAGHDLTLENLPPLKRAIPGLAEVSIGHALTADALLVGFPEAVRLYKAALRP